MTNTMDILSTITPTEYRTIRAQLEDEGLWAVAGNPTRERRSAARAEQILANIRK